jgi:hypothetical protein
VHESTRGQLDGVAVCLLIDLRTGELGPVGARISDGEDRIPTYLHGFTATCGVLVDTGSGGEAGGADDADDASGDESGEA